MIGALTGKAKYIQKNPIIFDVGGVGYQVYMPQTQVATLGDATRTIFVHTHVRDDMIALYGFTTTEQLEMFELLITVSGIGPRTGLAIIDRGVSEVHKAVMESDVDFFTTIPRLGKKNAQKIIIELKNKLGSTKDLDLSEPGNNDTKALLDALLGMGFEKQEILETFKKFTPNEITIEQKIRKALKYLGKSRAY